MREREEIGRKRIELQYTVNLIFDAAVVGNQTPSSPLALPLWHDIFSSHTNARLVHITQFPLRHISYMYTVMNGDMWMGQNFFFYSLQHLRRLLSMCKLFFVSTLSHRSTRVCSQIELKFDRRNGTYSCFIAKEKKKEKLCHSIASLFAVLFVPLEFLSENIQDLCNCTVQIDVNEH